MLFKNLKAHVSFSILTAASVCLIGTCAQAQGNDTPVFTPVGGWEVNKTDLSNVRGLNQMKLPCVITNEYDNGYVMRISGGGGNLLAMAVDFRQNVFVKGKKYNAMIAVGDSYVKQVSASAFNANTLIFNLRPLEGFYETAKSGGDIEIGIDANSMKFQTGGLSKAIADMEGCYTGSIEAPVPMTETLRSADAKEVPMPIAPAAPVESAALNPNDMANAPEAKPLPRSFDEIVGEGKAEGGTPVAQMGMSPMPGGEDKVIATQVSPRVSPAPSARPADIAANARANTVSRGVVVPATLPPVSAPRVATSAAALQWDAKAGEDIKIVLSRWAERAGYDLDWQAASDGKVAQDMNFNGNFEEAVGQLLAENSAASGIAGHVEAPTGQTKQIATRHTPRPPEPAPTPTTQANIPAYHDQWNAPQGANIQTVLGEWADKAGVAVVWQSYMSVPVKNPVQVSGSFEQAVQSLLDQYSNDASRPVAQLNIDPDTGERTLLMNLDKQG